MNKNIIKPHGQKPEGGKWERLSLPTKPAKNAPVKSPKKEEPQETIETQDERIAKRIARAGLCSRREAERWIEMGRVSVDGQILTSPACVVTKLSEILVDGNPLPDPTRRRIWLYYKPVGLVTTHRDPEGRRTVFEDVKNKIPCRVVSVGRLDLNSEGLLLLTNDGSFAREAELPAHHWSRTYRVRVFGYLSPEEIEERLDSLRHGCVVEGVRYGEIEAQLDHITGRNAWVSMTLQEGKNREIRKILNYFGLQVSRLIRISYGPYDIGKLEPGDILEVS